MATTAHGPSTRIRRTRELRAILEQHRLELATDVQVRIRDARSDNVKERQVLDEGELSESDVQDEIEFSLLQMKATMLAKIEAGLSRLTSGSYGNCVECGDGIAHARLRALPFAARCKDCEEAHEVAEGRERNTRLRSPSGLFLDA
jgi:DnaK suppressor protein